LEREPGLDDEPDGAAFSKMCSDATTAHAVPPPGSGLFLGALLSSTCSVEVEARTASRFLRVTGGSATALITAIACDQSCVNHKRTLLLIAHGAKGRGVHLAELSGSESLGMMLFDTLVRSSRGVDSVTGPFSCERFLVVSRTLVRGDGRPCEGSSELDLNRAASICIGGTTTEGAWPCLREGGKDMGAWCREQINIVRELRAAARTEAYSMARKGSPLSAASIPLNGRTSVSTSVSNRSSSSSSV
jgi:hypothetical protein